MVRFSVFRCLQKERICPPQLMLLSVSKTSSYFAKGTLKHTKAHQIYRQPQIQHHFQAQQPDPSTSVQPFQANMYSLTVLSTIFSLGTLSYTLPTSQPRDGPCNALIETSPWHVSNLVILDALPTAPTGSSIRFRVHDTNYGLEFETSCGLTMPEGTGSRTEQAQGWHPCEDDRVRFLYRSDGSKLPDKVEKPGNIQIRGSYVDDWYVTRRGFEDDFE